MGILWPTSNQLVFTNAGVRAAGAKAYFFEPDTDTPRPTYTTAELSVTHTHPVLADGYGRFPAIFLDFGDYRERVRTSGNTTLWDVDNVPNDAPTNPEDTVDANALYKTGDYIFAGKNGTRTGAVRCNGRTIGSASSGATERANPDCEDLFTYIWTNYANGQAAVSTGRGASAAADWSSNKTIALPDHRGASLVGFDDMGNSAASLLGSAPVVSGSGILAGSIIGANTHTLTVVQLPGHTHTFSATTAAGGAHTHTGTTASNGAHTHTGTTDSGGVDHTHSYNFGSAVNNIAGGGANTVQKSPPDTAATSGAASAYLHTHTFTTGSNGAHTHTFTTDASSTHTHTLTGTTDVAGSDVAHNNLSRAVAVCVLMKL
jgi:microcystin-dependent protein